MELLLFCVIIICCYRKTFFVSGTNNYQFNKLSIYNLNHNKFKKKRNYRYYREFTKLF